MVDHSVIVTKLKIKLVIENTKPSGRERFSKVYHLGPLGHSVTFVTHILSHVTGRHPPPWPQLVIISEKVHDKKLSVCDLLVRLWKLVVLKNSS